MNSHKLIRGLTAANIIMIFVIVILIIIILWLWKKAEKKERVIEFRDLWIDHGLYTRLFVIYELNDQRSDAVMSRLMKNQDDITNTVKKISGKDVEKLNKLLKEHINQTVEIVKTLKVGQNASTVIESWYTNGDAIASELNKLTGNPLESLKMAMKEHLDTTSTAINKYFAGDAQGEIKAYDKTLDHLKMMAKQLI